MPYFTYQSKRDWTHFAKWPSSEAPSSMYTSEGISAGSESPATEDSPGRRSVSGALMASRHTAMTVLVVPKSTAIFFIHDWHPSPVGWAGVAIDAAMKLPLSAARE